MKHTENSWKNNAKSCKQDMLQNVEQQLISSPIFIF